MAEFSPPQESSASDLRLKQLKIGLEKLSEQLSRNGMRLAVLHGNPFTREANCEPVVAAKQWFTPFGSPCNFLPRNYTLARRAKLNEVLFALHQRGKLEIVDLFDVFCPGDVCTYQSSDGQFLYRDVYSHPSVEGAQLSAPSIRQVLSSSTTP